MVLQIIFDFLNKKFKFKFDTGADVVLISDEIFSFLKNNLQLISLDLDSIPFLSASGDPFYAQPYLIKKLKIGEIYKYNVFCTNYDGSKINLLGQTLLSDFKILIEDKKNTLTQKKIKKSGKLSQNEMDSALVGLLMSISNFFKKLFFMIF